MYQHVNKGSLEIKNVMLSEAIYPFQRNETNYQEMLDYILYIYKQSLKKESEETELMTPDETAKFFKSSKQTINNWTEKGYLNPYYIGNKVFYKKNELIKNLKRINKHV